MPPEQKKCYLNANNTEGKAGKKSLNYTIPKPPDGGWGWVIMLSAMMCNVIVDGLVYVFGIFLPELVNYFDAPRSKVSLIGSALVAVYLGEGPIVSGLVNKFGCRPVVMAGSIISAIAFIAAMFSPSIGVLILTYGVIGGVGFGMIYLPSIIIVGHYFEQKRGLATGVTVCGTGIGTFVLAPLIRFLLDNYGWKNTMFIVAGIVLNVSICGALMRPLEQVNKLKKPKDTKTDFKDVTMANGTNGKGNIVENNHSVKDSTINGHGPSQFMNQNTEHHEKQSLTENGFTRELIRGQDTRTDIDNKQFGQLDLPHGIHAYEIDPFIRTGSSAIYHSQPIRTEILTRSGVTTGSHEQLNMRKRTIACKDFARPVYRKDIFYSGSIVNLPEYKSHPDFQSYLRSVSNIPSAFEHQESKHHKMCSCVPKPMMDIISEMVDISLFKDIGFICLCLGNFLAFAGYFVPYVYVVDRAILAGIDKTEASFLLSILGILATIGRLLAGVLANLKFVNSEKLNCVCMLIAGVSIFLLPFAGSYPMLVVLSSSFGLTSAAYISLTSIIICDLLGLEKLTNALGLLTMVRGVSIIIGPPIAGAVFRRTGSYDSSFYLGGSLFVAGALLHCVLLLPSVRSKRRSINKTNDSNDEELEMEVIQQS